MHRHIEGLNGLYDRMHEYSLYFIANGIGTRAYKILEQIHGLKVETFDMLKTHVATIETIAKELDLFYIHDLMYKNESVKQVRKNTTALLFFVSSAETKQFVHGHNDAYSDACRSKFKYQINVLVGLLKNIILVI